MWVLFIPMVLRDYNAAVVKVPISIIYQKCDFLSEATGTSISHVFVIALHAFWCLSLLNSGVLMRQYLSKNMFLFFWSLEFNSFAYTATNILKDC